MASTAPITFAGPSARLRFDTVWFRLATLHLTTPSKMLDSWPSYPKGVSGQGKNARPVRRTDGRRSRHHQSVVGNPLAEDGITLPRLPAHRMGNVRAHHKNRTPRNRFICARDHDVPSHHGHVHNVCIHAVFQFREDWSATSSMAGADSNKTYQRACGIAEQQTPSKDGVKAWLAQNPLSRQKASQEGQLSALATWGVS